MPSIVLYICASQFLHIHVSFFYIAHWSLLTESLLQVSKEVSKDDRSD